MSRFTIDHEAREDIKAIYRYIAEHHRTAALSVLQNLYETFQFLSTQPMLGQARDDLGEDVRSFTAGKYVVLFRSKSYGIEVIQVVHSAQDIDSVFRRRRE